MKLTDIQLKRLSEFIHKMELDTYPELPSDSHDNLTDKVLDHFFSRFSLTENARILDIGCGQGVALEKFQQRGYSPIGISLNHEDVAVCQNKGFEVYHMDQSFLDFDDSSLDFIWNRHCIEHSIFPMYSLAEMYRVLAPGAYIYIEVPAPDTVARHQTNPNHYSVLGKSMWQELINRTGFNLQESFDLKFDLDIGPDTYHSFIATKA